jgi:hypothetical protein
VLVEEAKLAPYPMISSAKPPQRAVKQWQKFGPL